MNRKSTGQKGYRRTSYPSTFVLLNGNSVAYACAIFELVNNLPLYSIASHRVDVRRVYDMCRAFRPRRSGTFVHESFMIIALTSKMQETAMRNFSAQLPPKPHPTISPTLRRHPLSTTAIVHSNHRGRSPPIMRHREPNIDPSAHSFAMLDRQPDQPTTK